LLLAIPLSGCATVVGNPADGLGGFLGNAFSWGGSSNRPVIDSPNARRVTGAAEEAEPLLPEAGNVWPGPLPPARSMSDLQRDMSAPLPPIDAAAGAPRAAAPAARPAPAPAPLAVPAPTPAAPLAAMPGGRVLQTPQGPASTVIGGNGVETFTLPNGRSGIVMPNANGTLTLIGPDGTSQTIPAPR
jgi:hypothetical protein